MPPDAYANERFLKKSSKKYTRLWTEFWKFLIVYNSHSLIYFGKVFVQRGNYAPGIRARVRPMSVPFSLPDAGIPSFHWMELCVKIYRVRPALEMTNRTGKF